MLSSVEELAVLDDDKHTMILMTGLLSLPYFDSTSFGVRDLFSRGFAARLKRETPTALEFFDSPDTSDLDSDAMPSSSGASKSN